MAGAYELDIIGKPFATNDIKNGASVVRTTQNGGFTSYSREEVVQISKSGEALRLDNRFDDTTYYTS
jgi:hypothetical protein